MMSIRRLAKMADLGSGHDDEAGEQEPLVSRLLQERLAQPND